MDSGHSNETSIIKSWNLNANAWTSAVRNGNIESRKLITNQAIIQTILDYSPSSLLDIGCGEGWLVREFASRNVRAIGTDGVKKLIDNARHSAKGEEYLLLSYEEVSAGVIKQTFDLIVCNFSLLGKESVERIMKAAPSMLKANGKLVVQTLHPKVANGDSCDQSGWREGSWEGFGPAFTHPAPWYFRTEDDWLSLFSNSGFKLLEKREPINPKTKQLASIIFVVEPA